MLPGISAGRPRSFTLRDRLEGLGLCLKRALLGVGEFRIGLKVRSKASVNFVCASVACESSEDHPALCNLPRMPSASVIQARLSPIHSIACCTCQAMAACYSMPAAIATVPGPFRARVWEHRIWMLYHRLLCIAIGLVNLKCPNSKHQRILPRSITRMGAGTSGAQCQPRHDFNPTLLPSQQSQHSSTTGP